MKLSTSTAKWIGITIVWVSGLNASFAQSTNMESALMSEGLTQQRAEEILGASVPIGGIIPYCLGASNLPPNWRLCDGSVVNNAQQGPFVGRAVPDLRGQFLFGAAGAETVGTKGGTNQTYSGISVISNGGHSHTVNGHYHTLSSRTGRIANEADGGLFSRYQMVANNATIVTGYFDVSTQGNPDTINAYEGQHYHYLGGNTGGASDRGTDSVAAHSHTVPDFQAELPPYTEVLYIIRIY